MFESAEAAQKELPRGDESSDGAERQRRLEDLDDRIGELFGNIAAAEAQLCEALGEFDDLGGWHSQGARSIEQWLSWRGGASRKVAADYAAVARRMAELPAVKESFSKGEISLSKARAVCSIATQITDAMLVEWARSATAADMDRIARTWNKMKSDEALLETELKRDRRECTWYVEDSGMMLLRARLVGEEGAIVAQALEQAADQERGAEGDDGDKEERTWSQRRADALVAVAERSLGADGAELKDRYLATLHIDLDVLTEDNPDGRCEISPGGGLHPETAARILCDAPAVSVVFKDGGVLDVGRKTRAISARMRRALKARDVTCRFPGCGSEAFLDGHHIRHWIKDLGPTELENLVLLCRHHHRRLHEGRCSIEKKDDGFVFRDRFGRVIPNAPPLTSVDRIERHNEELGLNIDEQTIVPPHYYGETMQMDSVMYVLDQEMRAE